MKPYKKINTKYFVPCIIALVQFAITFATDRGVFAAPSTKEQWLMYMGTKFFVLVFLVVFWQGVSFLFCQCRAKNPRVRAFLKYFFIYFGIMFAFQLILWPGVWRFDELNVLRLALELHCYFWQHWLTSAFYIFSLQLLPLPAGIVMMQFFIISLIVAYIMLRVHDIVQSKWVNLLFVVFFLPPSIMHALYPLRLSLNGYMELFLFAIIVIKIYDKSEITFFNCVFGGTWLVILATWRTEGIAYMLLLPPVLLVLFWKKFSWKQGVAFLMIAILLFISIDRVQKTQVRDSNTPKERQTYMLTAYAEMTRGIVKTDFRSSDKQADLQAIDAIFPVDVLLVHSGEEAFIQHRKFTPEQFDRFEETIRRLALQNPDALLKNAAQVYRETNTNNLVVLPASALDEVNHGNSPEDLVDFFEAFHSYRLTHSLNQTVRTLVANILDGRQPKDLNKRSWIAPVFYNSFPAVIILFVLMIYWMIKRNKLFLLPLTIFAKTFLIFATAPQRYFMYYFPLYIVGYGLGMILLIFYISQRKKKIKIQS